MPELNTEDKVYKEIIKREVIEKYPGIVNSS
jgi:hypothetical protein